MTIPIRTTSRAAFTLTELMISIALALLLIIGVNLVFQATSDTLSAGQKVAEANRDEQSLHTVFSEDMRSLVLPDDAPFLFIRSQRRAGFYDRAEMDADADFNGTEGTVLTYDDDADPNTAEAADSPAIYNRRNHRIDTFGFFARGQFHRQTGAASNELIADAVSNEAYIWYGHVKKPNYNQTASDATGHPRFGPAEDTLDNNPENWFVEDWTLGRAVLLLQRPEDPHGLAVSDRGGNSMTTGFIQRKAWPDDSGTAAPLTVNSEDTSGDWMMQWSRYDAAATTFQLYRRILANFIEDTSNDPWYDAVSHFRHHYSPVVHRPLDPASVARSVPGLMDGTSQFIVEFAGDFVTQNNLGVVIAAEPDGVLDYIVLADPGGPDEVRTTRWYGMPRDLDGNGIIRAMPASGGNSNDLVDVVPVINVIIADMGTPPPNFVWFERYWPAVPSGGFYAGGGADMNPNEGYLAAWGPDTLHLPKPQYIRFIVGTVPTSANADDRIAEYVFKVK